MKLLTFLTLALFLTGCSLAGTAIGAGATAGVAASQEGGLQRAWTDAKIQTQINDLWFRSDVDMFRKLDMTVNQGRVLLTGVVQKPEHRVEAVRLAWQPKGVRQVINEIRVADSENIFGFARDAWIAARLRTAITLDRNIKSINYNIDTVEGIIYLLGVAQNQVELNRVIEIARTIPDVKQVVSYVKMADASKQDSLAPSPAQIKQPSVHTSKPQNPVPLAPAGAGGAEDVYQEPIESEPLQ
ncbi:MAG: BON domain-containing protein [Alphaproteobacteria bacterium]|nr:BON domain-containing protein [Alphaproteobacteria bacterium]